MDAKQYLGTDPDQLPVAEAVRMSMSIPFFFKPVRWPNPIEKQDHQLVDGGMLSNYPIWTFDSEGLPEWPTIGIRLTAPQQINEEQGLDLVPAPNRRFMPPPLQRTLSFGTALIDTMTKFHDRLYLDTATFARTVSVPTGEQSGTNFRLTDVGKQTLYVNGEAAVKEFLTNR